MSDNVSVAGGVLRTKFMDQIIVIKFPVVIFISINLISSTTQSLFSQSHIIFHSQ